MAQRIGLGVAYSHQPEGYRCPFCRLAAGEDLSGEHSKQADIIFRDETVTAFISSAWWPANPGHVLVVPNAHYENIYALPDDVLAALHRVGKRVALALMATCGCDGTSFRQHNGPGADQEVWHYHLHVFPRYVGDLCWPFTLSAPKSWHFGSQIPGGSRWME